MRAKRSISRKDLERHLEEQVKFLENSANSFDKGFEGEAKRLAATIRLLVHDTKMSASLLGQLGKKSGLFPDTKSENDKRSLMPYQGLVSLNLNITGGETQYVAMLDDAPGKYMISFDDWWSSSVFRDNSGRGLSRKDIILIAANQDGGAHVDSALDEVYSNISKGISTGWKQVKGKDERYIEGAERAAIRQITHELLKCLISGYSKKQKNLKGAVFGGMRLTEVTDSSSETDPSKMKMAKMGRNEPCPCGSGRKYKLCHGR